MKYRKKPVVIEAERFSGVPSKTINEYPIFLAFHGERFMVVWDYDGPAYLNIHTLEGCMRADIGDWIIKGIKGEFYPIKDSIFRETYEEVTDDAEGL